MKGLSSLSTLVFFFIHNCFPDLFSKFSSVDLRVSLSLYRTVVLGWHLSHCLQITMSKFYLKAYIHCLNC